MMKVKPQNKTFITSNLINYCKIAILILIVSGCQNTIKLNSEHNYIEDTLSLNLFSDKINETLNDGDSILKLSEIFDESEYNSLYIFPSYTPIKKIHDLIGNYEGLPYTQEVKGNEDLIILSLIDKNIKYFILKENIIISDLDKYKFGIDTAEFLLREFQRENKRVIYLINDK